MHAQGTALPAGQGDSKRDQAPDEPIAYTVARFARLLGKHPNTVYEWVAKGVLRREQLPERAPVCPGAGGRRGIRRPIGGVGGSPLLRLPVDESSRWPRSATRPESSAAASRAAPRARPPSVLSRWHRRSSRRSGGNSLAAATLTTWSSPSPAPTASPCRGTCSSTSTRRPLPSSQTRRW